MQSQSTEIQLIHLCLLFTSLSLSTHISQSILHIHPLLLHIFLGAIFSHFNINLKIPPPETFTSLQLVGILGIYLSALDAGLETNPNQLRSCALRAFLIAFLGVLFPLIFSIFVLWNEGWKVGFAVGASIAPTSLGVTSSLIQTQNELNTPLGILVSIAAVFDDAISLILLSQVTTISNNNNINTWIIMKPLVLSLCFILFTLALTWLLPKIYKPYILNNLKKLPNRIKPNDHIFTWWITVIITLSLTWVAIKVQTSILLAAYLSGVSFSSIITSNIKSPWYQYTSYLNVLFFACTIGFVIPLNLLFKKDSISLGFLLGFVAIVGKLLCAFGAIGWGSFEDCVALAVSMLGRGEFGF